MPFTQAPVVVQASAQTSGQNIGSHGPGNIGSQAQLVPDPVDAAVEATLVDATEDDVVLDTADDALVVSALVDATASSPAAPVMVPPAPPTPKRPSSSVSSRPRAHVTAIAPTSKRPPNRAEPRMRPCYLELVTAPTAL